MGSAYPICSCFTVNYLQTEIREDPINIVQHGVPHQDLPTKVTRPTIGLSNSSQSSTYIINFRNLNNNIVHRGENSPISPISPMRVHHIPKKRNKSSIELGPLVDQNNFFIINGKKTFIQRGEDENNFREAKLPHEYKARIKQRLAMITSPKQKFIHTQTPNCTSHLHWGYLKKERCNSFCNNIPKQNKKITQQTECYSNSTLRDESIIKQTSSNKLLYDNEILSLSSNAMSDLNINKCFSYNKAKLKSKYKIITEPFDNKKLEFINNILKKEELIIDAMDNSVIDMIIDSIEYIRIPPYYTLYNTDKNKDENLFYIIYKGKAEMKINNIRYELKKGNSVSTRAIITNTNSFSYIKTLSKRVYLFALSLDTYISKLTEFLNKLKEEKISILKQLPFFINAFDKQSLTKLANNIVSRKYNERAIVIEEFQPNSNMYLIVEGSILVLKSNEVITKLTKYEMFGGVCLFTQMTSNYCYVAEQDTELYRIPYEVFDDIFGEKPIEKFIHNIFLNSIKSSEILSKYFTVNNISELFNKFQLKYYYCDFVLGPKNKKLFIPIAGNIYQTKSVLKSISQSTFKNNPSIFDNKITVKGEIYGENYLNELSNNIKYSIITDECVIFEASWVDILKITKSYSNRNISLYDKMALMKKYPLFKGISDINLFYLAENLKSHIYKKNELIIKNGPSSDKFFILTKGQVKIDINDIKVKLIDAPNCFGDISRSPKSYLQQANFIAESKDVEVYYLEKETYNDIIDCSILQPYKNLLNAKDLAIKIEQLYYIKDLGQGSYGNVYLVHDKKRLYAMKTAEIQAMVQNKKLAQGYLDEKSIMSTIEHPFIVQLINTFKTRDFIFFLIEYINGFTLREYIEKEKQTKLNSTRNIIEIKFLAAILLSVLSYLQKKRILHRDLKPDNIMIDKTGYLKVIDFGIAKKLTGKDSTHTLIGTAHYMAPEVVSGKSYSFAVDIWSVGVILYEVFYGKIPFGFGLTNHQSIYNEILYNKLIIPCDPKIELFNLFIKDMLDRNFQNRMNCFRKWKNYDLFKEFDFNKIMNMSMESPIKLKERIFSDETKMLNNINFTFHHFMKNYIYSSCNNEFEELFRKNTKADIYLNEF